MGKPTKTSETTILAIEILSRIPRSHHVTSKELQQQLRDIGIEKDIRSIQRQLESLTVSILILSEMTEISSMATASCRHKPRKATRA